MSLATIFCRAAVGVEAPLVTIEVHLANGLPAFAIVGLPEKAVQESRDRVRSALLNSGFAFPSRRITVNLAPAELPKEGGRFDLAIAIGVLKASEQIQTQGLDRYEFLGELTLSGRIRPTRAVLPAAIAARQAGRALLVSTENVAEATLIDDATVYAAAHLLDVCSHLSGDRRLAASRQAPPGPVTLDIPDLADVRGQAHAKRAAEIAAAGGHNLLLVGPPGTGKSMLASRLPGLLPPMTEQQAVEVAVVRSVYGRGLDVRRWRQRPFRQPHHPASGVALVGGGGNPKPGEVSLAHHGILFLDELPEFDRKVLEVLREPLETGRITISRAARQAEFPARFQLVAAMNPCPCGNLGDPRRACRCTPDQINRYQGRISGPFLDRIDLHIEVPVPTAAELAGPATDNIETSAVVCERVTVARDRQIARQGRSNCALGGDALDDHCRLSNSGKALLLKATEQLALSARAYHRVLRVARTIADLAADEAVNNHHLAEAISMRPKLRAGSVV